MIGKQIFKPVTSWAEYTKTAIWCNANRAAIEDKGEYYEIVAIPESPEPTLDELKKARLSELKAAFNTASEEAHCTSSAGFEIDADEIAYRNIEGLVLVLQPEETTLFRAYDNTFRAVTREQLETMRKEIVVNSQYLYQAKWTLEEQIMQVQTAQAVAGIDITAEGLAELADSLKTAASEGSENAETV